MGKGRFDHHEDTPEVYRLDAIPIGQRELLTGSRDVDTGVVDENIQAAELCHGGVQDVGSGLFSADVGLDKETFLSQFLDDRDGGRGGIGLEMLPAFGFFAHIGNDHFGPLTGEFEGDAPPDPGACTRYNSDAIFQMPSSHNLTSYRLQSLCSVKIP